MQNTQTLKAMVVHSNPEISEWIHHYQPEWVMEVPVTSAQAVWEMQSTGEIAGDANIIIISDLLFYDEPEHVAALIAGYSAMQLPVIVLCEDPSLEGPINEAVLNSVWETVPDRVQGPYYYLKGDVDDPAKAIDDIMAAYYHLIDNLPASGLPVLTSPPAGVATPEPTAPAYSQPEAPSAPSLSGFEEKKESTPTKVFTPTTSQVDSGYTAEELLQIRNTLGHPGFIVASTSSKGGSGKTTSAVCVAITIALGSRLAVEQGIPGAEALKVCVVDMDVRDGQIGFAINQMSPSILNLYIEEEEYTPDTIAKHIIEVDRFGISCLLAPKRGRTADYLTPQFYLDVLHQLRLMFDVIILDTSVNYLDPLLRQVVYPEADAILLVTNLSKGAVLGMPRWMDEVTSGEDGTVPVSKDKIGVVINQSLGGVGMDLHLVRKAAKGAPVLVAIPADNRAVTKASNEGTLHDLIRKHEQIGAVYYTLASKVWKQTPLASPLEAYLNSPEKTRDDVLKAKGRTENPNAVSTFTPLSEADKPKQRGGGFRNLLGKDK